ncbi:MAG: DUF2335 domain-containing protein [Dehalococcoidia bacterium]|nr:DUF2335 domain-containing protein [Dehalococcoidia bacterium]
MREENRIPDRELVHPDHPEDEASALESPKSASILVQQESWSGPLPPPDVLLEYNFVENGAERLFRMAERQSEHRIDMATESLKADNSIATRGQWFGLIVVLAVLGLAAYMAYLGATAAAAAVVAIDVVGLATVFVYSRLSRQDTRERQLEDEEG